MKASVKYALLILLGNTNTARARTFLFDWCLFVDYFVAKLDSDNYVINRTEASLERKYRGKEKSTHKCTLSSIEDAKQNCNIMIMVKNYHNYE